jgi:hypothetical protein
MELPPMPIPDTLRGIDDLIRVDLEAYRDFWFHQLLLATLLVVLGLVLEGPELWYEIISIIRQWCSVPKFSTPEKHAPNWVKLLAFIGWLLIVGGVAGEYVADSFLSRADGYVQKFDEILLNEATRQSSSANAKSAMAYARAAETEKQAAQENSRAAEALKSAEIARKSAEGFQLQIAQASERAANAEARAAEAALELARLKSPRSLTHLPELTAALKQFKDIEYRFSAVCPEEECIQLLKQFDGVLHDAGWRRGKSVGGFPSINIYGKGVDLSVPQALLAGVQISVESSEPLAILQSQPIEKLPEYLRAAIVLNLSLSTSLSPPQQTVGKMVRIDPGTSTSVQISVGKKE